MRGSIRHRGEERAGSWEYIVDTGMHTAERCPTCKKRFWVERRPRVSCPKCGGALTETEERRRAIKAGFATQKECQAAMNKLLVAVEQHNYTAPTKASVKEYLVKEWLPAVKATIRPSTYNAYVQHVECHIVPHIHSSCCSASTMPISLITASRFGKMPTTSPLRRISRLRRSCGLFDQICRQCCREGGEGGYVRTRIAEYLRHLREARPELFDHAGQLGGHLLRGRLREDGAHHGGDEGLRALRHPAEQVAHEVGPTALPAGTGQERVDRLGQASVVVGDQLHAAEPAAREVPEERPPGGLVLAREEVEAEDLAVAVGVHGTGHDAGTADDAPALAHAHRQGVEPQVGIGAIVEGPGAEGGDLLVEAPRHLRDLALGDALDAEGLHEAIDTARRDAAHVALGDHGDEGALGTPAALEQPVGEVAAAAQFGYRQGDSPARVSKGRSR